MSSAPMFVSLMLLLVLGSDGLADCNYGNPSPDECGGCVCWLGYADGDDGRSKCSECAPGFLRDENTGLCSNGRVGASCTTTSAYPHFGCSYYPRAGQAMQVGECTRDGTRDVFPCKCPGDNCEEAISMRSACYPSGPRMYTTFPNEPAVPEEFAITVVGCGISEDDVYAVIPAYNSDLENTCDTLGHPVNVPPQCWFDASDVTLGGGNETLKDCNAGFQITGFEAAGSAPLTEMTFGPIRFLDESVFRGPSPVHNEMDRPAFFRLCAQRTVNGEQLWQEVANHDAKVEARDGTFKVSRSPVFSLGAGEGLNSKNICCEGLKIGSLCLPLWVFLLLWFLMALCLCGMGYTLHKNNQEIDAAKNNEKYETFNVDSEMTNLAAEQADEDDDI